MRTYQNPFRARASEQQGDDWGFVRNFGSGMLDLVPETAWDRPLVLRSAPGGGKTSLMRLFTIESLELVHERADDVPMLARRLKEHGALDDRGPTRLGVLLNLERDYRSLLDLAAAPEAALRLFFRLLDARVVVAVMRAALRRADLPFPAACEQFELKLDLAQDGVEEAAERLGGTTGDALLSSARAAEREILSPLDSLRPVEHAPTRGPAALDSLRVLSAAGIAVSGSNVDLLPLVMLDDGHELGASQREALLERLRDRSLGVARWYSERFEALSTEELMVGGIEGRDFELVELEAPHRRAARQFRWAPVMKDAANLRADRALVRYTNAEQEFCQLLEVDPDTMLGERAGQVLADLRRRLGELADGRERYERWVEEVSAVDGYEGAVRMRELEILIRSDEGRAQQELFDTPLDEKQLERRSTSALREAARLFLSREFRVPYYAGPDMMARLGSYNMEQFLALCGDLFEQMLAEVTLGRRPRLSPGEQDAVVRRASERLWREIPRRVPHGRDVIRLIEAIAALSQRDTFRDTAPYPPGPNGTALLMEERAQLVDDGFRAKLPGSERLFHALGSAVANNVLSVELEYSVKNRRVMVIYLNRLLCPRFNLPLQRGNFRERRLDVMCNWMIEPRHGAHEPGLEVAEPEPLSL
jgi:hypothetical protein